MAQTVYASFADATACEQAAGALLDYGVRNEDLSVVTHETFGHARMDRVAGSGDTMGLPAQTGSNTTGSDVPGSVARTGQIVGPTETAGAYEDASATRAADSGFRGGEARTGAVADRASAVESDDYATTGSIHQRVSDAAVRPYDDMATGAVVPAADGYGMPVDQRIGDQTSTLNPTIGAGRTGSQDPLSIADPEVADREITSGASVYNSPGAAASGPAATDDDIEQAAKSGLTVTTAADAGSGAAKGAGWGLAIGVLAGIACLIVPGVGWVVGGGALATAIGAALGTTVAGAIAGGVTGYLKDQGVPEHVAAQYGHSVSGGGAMLAVHVPSNGVDAEQAERIMLKYGATNINVY